MVPCTCTHHPTRTIIIRQAADFIKSTTELIGSYDLQVLSFQVNIRTISFGQMYIVKQGSARDYGFDTFTRFCESIFRVDKSILVLLLKSKEQKQLSILSSLLYTDYL